METVRQQKVSRLLQKELNEYFRLKGKAEYNNALITVTTIRISSDFSVARVYVSLFMAKEKETFLKVVNEKKWDIRKFIAEIVRKQLRIVPELNFYIDDSLDYAQRIDDLLKK